MTDRDLFGRAPRSVHDPATAERERVEVIFVHATPDALCVRETEDAGAIWLPTSQAEVVAGEAFEGRVVAIEAPHWLLRDRGLI